MSINVPLLRKVLEHITEHPEEWNQATWARETACGSVCCVAGHAAVMTGHTLKYEDGRAYVTTDGRSIMEVAAEELGLGDTQAINLFDGSNRLSTLWSYASHLTRGEIKVPDNLPADTWDD